MIAREGALVSSMPGFAGDLTVMPGLRNFKRLYPKIDLEISINENFVTLFEAGFQTGLRLGDRPEQDAIGVRHRSVRGSCPAGHGAPDGPRDPLEHSRIR
ncbi:MAG: hypothetical protein AAF982_02635 [Pseudomonadota bacterium]